MLIFGFYNLSNHKKQIVDYLFYDRLRKFGEDVRSQRHDVSLNLYNASAHTIYGMDLQSAIVAVLIPM